MRSIGILASPTANLPSPVFWQHFTDTFNEATGRDCTPEELLHYIMSRRKWNRGTPGRWEPLGKDHQRLQTPSMELLTPEQWEVVHEMYEGSGVSADVLLTDAEERRAFLLEFVRRTGAHIPELVFVAALVARRKDHLLPHSEGPDGPRDDEENLGFGDIDEIDNA